MHGCRVLCALDVPEEIRTRYLAEPMQAKSGPVLYHAMLDNIEGRKLSCVKAMPLQLHGECCSHGGRSVRLRMGLRIAEGDCVLGWREI